MSGERYIGLTLSDLECLPTLCVGQADSLKVDNGDGYRVWLSRCGVEDGEPFANKVSVERFNGDTWRNYIVYEAR